MPKRETPEQYENRRAHELARDGIDAGHIAERAALEARLMQISLLQLFSEQQSYGRGCLGWEWRAVHEVIHHRCVRLHRKDHTQLK